MNKHRGAKAKRQVHMDLYWAKAAAMTIMKQAIKANHGNEEGKPITAKSYGFLTHKPYRYINTIATTATQPLVR